jgi:hypothetical protein
MEAVMPPSRKKRAAAKSRKARPAVKAPAVAAAAAEVDGEDQRPTPGPPPRGMTTEQIRRVGNRIAEHERDLKNSTSRR